MIIGLAIEMPSATTGWLISENEALLTNNRYSIGKVKICTSFRQSVNKQLKTFEEIVKRILALPAFRNEIA